MVEERVAYRDFWVRAASCWVLAVVAGVLLAGPVRAQPASMRPPGPPSAPSAAAAGSAPPAPRWIGAARVNGRLQAADIGLVINTADPYSVQVGDYYIQQRQLAPEQVLRLVLPVKPTWTD